MTIANDLVAKYFPHATPLTEDGSAYKTDCPECNSKDALLIKDSDDSPFAVLNCTGTCANNIPYKKLEYLPDIHKRQYFGELYLPTDFPKPASNHCTIAHANQYDYRDRNGKLVQRVYRKIINGKKRMWQKFIDTSGQEQKTKPLSFKPVPYNVHAYIDKEDTPIFIVEGEKDVDTLRQYGVFAMCAPQSDNARMDWSFINQTRHIVIIADNDLAGYEKGYDTAINLLSLGYNVKLIHLPVGKKSDVTDFFEMGYTKEQLFDVISNIKSFLPSIDDPYIIPASALSYFIDKKLEPYRKRYAKLDLSGKKYVADIESYRHNGESFPTLYSFNDFKEAFDSDKYNRTIKVIDNDRDIKVKNIFIAKEFLRDRDVNEYTGITTDLLHQDRRQKGESGLTLHPRFNLWQGFKLEPVQGDIAYSGPS